MASEKIERVLFRCFDHQDYGTLYDCCSNAQNRVQEASEYLTERETPDIRSDFKKRKEALLAQLEAIEASLFAFNEDVSAMMEHLRADEEQRTGIQRRGRGKIDRPTSTQTQKSEEQGPSKKVKTEHSLADRKQQREISRL